MLARRPSINAINTESSWMLKASLAHGQSSAISGANRAHVHLFALITGWQARHVQPRNPPSSPPSLHIYKRFLVSNNAAHTFRAEINVEEESIVEHDNQKVHTELAATSFHLVPMHTQNWERERKKTAQQTSFFFFLRRNNYFLNIFFPPQKAQLEFLPSKYDLLCVKRMNFLAQKAFFENDHRPGMNEWMNSFIHEWMNELIHSFIQVVILCWLPLVVHKIITALVCMNEWMGHSQCWLIYNFALGPGFDPACWVQSHTLKTVGSKITQSGSKWTHLPLGSIGPNFSGLFYPNLHFSVHDNTVQNGDQLQPAQIQLSTQSAGSKNNWPNIGSA